LTGAWRDAVKTTPTTLVAGKRPIWFAKGAALSGIIIGGIMGGTGCTHKIDVQPIKVEPLHMTLDINIKVERELEDFFDFEDRAASSVPVEAQPDAPPVVVPPAAGDAAPASTPEGGAP